MAIQLHHEHSRGIGILNSKESDEKVVNRGDSEFKGRKPEMH